MKEGGYASFDTHMDTPVMTKMPLIAYKNFREPTGPTEILASAGDLLALFAKVLALLTFLAITQTCQLFRCEAISRNRNLTDILADSLTLR